MNEKNKWFIVNVEAVIFHQNRWLLIRRSEKEEHAPGLITLVGGKVEDAGFFPDILETNLKREVKEEIGIEIDDNIIYLESKSFITDRGEPVVDIVFLCRYKSGKPEPVNPEEVGEVFWMTFEEIMADEKIPDFVKSSIEKARKVLELS